jgi:manganese transport protein
MQHHPKLGALEILRFIGPGLLVTVGFIDPGNWASNIAAGSQYGYTLLWMVTLSTVILIFIQHNSAHLGIVTGLCLSEASTRYFKRRTSLVFLSTAVIASIATALAEILGMAIGLNMILKIPIYVGAIISSISVVIILLSNNYKRLEKITIGFVSLIGLSFLFELSLVHIDWQAAGIGWVIPTIPTGSMPILMSVLGAVVMPHNIFLHSEIIQSRQWNLEAEPIIKKQLKFEFLDTLFAMGIGWVINSSMIIIAAATFFYNGLNVNELPMASSTLKPILGNAASFVFGFALILSGFSSSITAAMAGSSIYAGIFMESFDIEDQHSRTGVIITIVGGLLLVFLLKDPLKALIYSQMALSVQLPLTIFSLLYLTSSTRVMGKFANSRLDKTILWIIGLIVVALNIGLLLSLLWSCRPN